MLFRSDDEIRELQEQVKTANESLSDKSIEVSNLLGKLQSSTSKVDELEELYGKAKVERDELDWENERLKIKGEELNKRITTLEDEIKGLKIDLVKSGEAYKELSEQTTEALKWHQLITLAIRKVFK